ncbi:putative exopolysaccharide production protein ExoZ [Hyphomonas polymorpha PS728]|uniref:Putative exopolysaccharide production protein ExoZ n=1 Tax=Hyphomonas polymorpha PS728 TaxID=1280954 RepID=A0A062VIC1_9PROT|nr:acyltransferase [Hyphomonas polymorpha]KCZ98301.1 putative exopolysaccharide production protein ExoZ [Hyphomonas polymorpha PS728]
MKLYSIQLLRGIAALLVVFYHAVGLQLLTIGPEKADNAMLGGVFASGFAGVDLFFVISGFIMVWVTRRGEPGLPGVGEFLFARITRIYPLWWAAAALAATYYIFLHVPEADDPAWRAAVQNGEGIGFLVKSFLLIPQPDLPVLSLGWTLMHEMYFYAVFACLLLVPRAVIPLALLGWGGLVVAASLLGLSEPVAINFLTLAIHPLTMEFIFGAMIGLMVSSGFVARSGILTLVAALWFTASLCLQGEFTPYTHQWGRVLAFGIPGALLVYGFAALEQHGRLVWLVPVAGAVIVCAAVYQMQGVSPAADLALRQSATLVAVPAGAVAAGLVLGLGWLGGRYTPGLLYALGRPLEMLYAAGRHIGDWSYSIYLGHIFAIGGLVFLQRWLATAGDWAAPFVLGAPGVLDDLLYIAGAFAGALLAGWFGYMLVERPALSLFRMVRRRLFPYSRRAREDQLP